MMNATPTTGDLEYGQALFDKIVGERRYPLPSEWLEEHRYLPKELSPHPGFYSYDYTPYLRKLVDYFHPSSPIHKIVFMKPSQIGATTGVLEGGIAYRMKAVPSPMLYISADKELVTIGMKTKIERMLDSCGLRELIGSQTGDRSTGNTQTEKEFPGGYLHAIGAQNPARLRQMTYLIILFDELDGMPDRLGDEGDPLLVAENRSIVNENTRKLLYLSTPLVLQTSKIYKLYKQGDQQNYFVPCKNCKTEFVMHWHAKNDHGDKYGVAWEYIKLSESEWILDEESVRYICPHCGYPLQNFDKAWMLPRGDWVPTATAHEADLASHWLNACYSPPGMFSWTGMAKAFLKGWDPIRDRVKDIDAYRSFRNTMEGLPFEEQGEAVTYERVATHRRPIYALGQVPNKAAVKETGSSILETTCATDVQGDGIFIDVKGWCEGGRSYTLDFQFWDGNTQKFEDPVWRKLEKLLEEKIYVADDGRQYRIGHTLIDAAYGERTDVVYQFCRRYTSGVSPIFGTDYLPDGLTYTMLSKATIEKAGCVGYRINTTKLKDKLSRILKAQWTTGELQPEWYPNFPDDLRDDYINMFSSEYKAEKRDKKTGKFLGIEWHLVPGRENHALDTFVYNLAVIEMLAEWTCTQVLRLPAPTWQAYWDYLKRRK